ncbi:MAG TPA: PAS domain S-box protein [Burkholderiales bacterium]
MSPAQHTRDAPGLPGDDELFRSVLEQSATGIAVCSVETGRFLRVNDAICRMTGYSEQELLRKTYRDITHPDDIELDEGFLRELLSGQIKTHAHDKRYLRKDGSEVWVHVVAAVGRDASGSPRCYAYLIHDITANIKALEALGSSEERFRRMVEMSSDWYWEQDAQFRFVELPGFEGRHFSEEDTVGRTRWELPQLAPLPEKAWEQHKAKLERHEPFFDFVFLRYNKLGELRYLSTSGEPVFDRDGQFEGYRGIGRDVTEQVRAYKALEDSEARYRMLFDVHPHPMWVLDSKTLAFLAVNEAAVRHYGYSKEEFLAMTADQIRPAEDVSRLLKAFQDQSGSYRHRVWRHVKKSGELIDVEIVSFNLEFDGRPARLGVVTDITERSKSEERAREIGERYQQLLKDRKG